MTLHPLAFWTLLLVVLLAGGAAGYGLRIFHEWLRECRLMVLHGLASLTREGRS